MLCSDSPNPRNPSTYAADAQAGLCTVGRIRAELALDIRKRARSGRRHGAEDRYTGPWNRPTASTILLLGNTGDTLLPYQDALAMSHDLAHARLLTVEGYGHTEANNPSTCALNY